MEIPNTFENLTSDSFDNAIWTSANSTSKEDVGDRWADFTAFEGKPEAGDEIREVEKKSNEQVPETESTEPLSFDSQVIVTNPEKISTETLEENPLQIK